MLSLARALPTAAAAAPAAAAGAATSAAKCPDEPEHRRGAGKGAAYARHGRGNRMTEIAARPAAAGVPARPVVPHWVGIFRVRAAQRAGKSRRPRLLHVERDCVRQDRLEAFGRDFRRLHVETVELSRFEIEPEAGELVHDRAAERGRRAHEVQDKAVEPRERGHQQKREWIGLHEFPCFGMRGRSARG